MRPYEMLVLASAELEDPKEEIAKVEEVVRSLGGEVSKTDFWGKRRLAYPIQKKTEGFYAVCNFTLNPDQLLELNRVLGLRPNIYRQMTVRLDEK
ncbi:MAG: 30S ribosomal protein S6 [Synergistaceae bacterium]|nr:30S ribosomal protein S6 [Synergistaceae bacterium]NCC56845.1 30S ribosomal protein S6 [Synergistales bacterium]MDD3390233.1 30S ribosomal protein S6 [Synergistaceae bacterium]MDD3689354.1 30S ribosomal protein S6 [Synergistaceae bacterium]MDD4020182.1 30S ribosomal protein S6 [Synergistaceae bacterium]